MVSNLEAISRSARFCGRRPLQERAQRAYRRVSVVPLDAQPKLRASASSQGQQRKDAATVYPLAPAAHLDASHETTRQSHEFAGGPGVQSQLGTHGKTSLQRLRRAQLFSGSSSLATEMLR